MRTLITVMILFPFTAFAQSVYVHFTDGSSSTFPIDEIRSTDFSGNMMRVFLWDGTDHAWDMAEIKRYQFNDLSTGITAGAPSAIALHALSPNPSSGEVRIGFELETAGEVLIEIYDARGSLVATVDRRHFPSGEHTVLWNGSDANGSTISSGTYICRIDHGAHIASTPLIIEH